VVDVAGASQSRKLIAQARRQLSSTGNEEEARATLQSRLNLYSKLMFWSFVTLLVFLGGMYSLFLDSSKVPYRDYVFGGASVLLAAMALIWRGVLVHGEPTVARMYQIDLLFATTIGLAFGASAALQHHLKPAAFTSLIFASFTVFTRALLVPSSGLRTAIVSSITFVGVLAGGVVAALLTPPDLARPAHFVGGATFCAVAIVIAANGSSMIYGLRRKISEAMQLGQYKLGRKIGQGGIGTVYHAQHALLRRPTAVKLLQPDRVSPEDLDRFEREVQMMSQLTHPNTVAVYDYGPSLDGVFYYAMEYLDGINLQQLVATFGPLPAGRAVHILTQVCGALQEAHDAGLIHRDIKPANIILCVRGGAPDVAKVVDYGLVKEITQKTGESTQVVLGTPAYLAPEAVTDPGRLGPAFDLYSLGCVAYFLVTGRPVFDGKTETELCIQHVTKAPRPPSEVTTNRVPAELEAVIMQCLRKPPSERFASASALADALAAVPTIADWDVGDARAWWRDFHARPRPEDQTAVETRTITVDLDHRTVHAAVDGPEPASG
jgi:hypothetical protein